MQEYTFEDIKSAKETVITGNDVTFFLSIGPGTYIRLENLRTNSNRYDITTYGTFNEEELIRERLNLIPVLKTSQGLAEFLPRYYQSYIKSITYEGVVTDTEYDHDQYSIDLVFKVSGSIDFFQDSEMINQLLDFIYYSCKALTAEYFKDPLLSANIEGHENKIYYEPCNSDATITLI